MDEPRAEDGRDLDEERLDQDNTRGNGLRCPEKYCWKVYMLVYGLNDCSCLRPRLPGRKFNMRGTRWVYGVRVGGFSAG